MSPEGFSGHHDPDLVAGSSGVQEDQVRLDSASLANLSALSGKMEVV